MSAPNPWDLSPPQRPSTATFNGIAKSDRSDYPPDPTTMPNAAEYNALCWLGVALGQMMANASISIAGGATPAIQSLRSPCTTVVPGTFTVTHVGTGDVQISWPSGTFPAQIGPPKPYLNHSAAGQISAISGANSVTVLTADSSGTPADLPFTVDVF